MIFETDKLACRSHLGDKVVPDLDSLEETFLKHLKSARKSALRAHAPYSKFRVGASVLAEDPKGKNRQFAGCNIENASYGATMCAERVAIFNSVSAGFSKFRILALSTLDSAGREELNLRSPCGLCRQVMSEFFGEHTLIIIDGGTRGAREFVDLCNIDTLLPWRFVL